MLSREREVPVKKKENLLHCCGILILYALRSCEFRSKGRATSVLKDGFPKAHLTTRERVESSIDLRRLFAVIDADPAIAPPVRTSGIPIFRYSVRLFLLPTATSWLSVAIQDGYGSQLS
jgi:hypothetical protein